MTPMPVPGETDPWAKPVKPPLPRKELKGLQRRRNGPALRHMAGHLATGAVTTGLIAWSWGTYWMIPAMFAQGTVIVFLFAPMHECTHGTAFRTRRLNSAVATFCGVLMMRPALYFRYRHAAHHSYTQDPERDPDQVPMPDGVSGYLGEVFGMEFWPKVVGTLYRSCTGRFNDRERFFLPESVRPRVLLEARLMVGLYVLVGAVCAVTGTWVQLLAFWLLPRVVAEPALRLVRMAEHTGMAEGADPLTNTRTTLTNPLVRFLYWNMPFHAEHHLAPSVPFHNLRRLHRALPGAPEEREYVVSKGYVRAHRDIVGNLGNGSGSTVPTSTSAAVTG
ncbi:fatty acid desaturase [Streptomyces sp. HNM0575]|uniref:fatty acid desaturase n=1 Tax=Streptomyces sp. HNM0575 TaxID=2716338 RepID=UPI00145E87A0|nr:fatty acid desaturase [Streptomyces sp. HNM0575]NLU74618.1 fatty acid desaturase [Streptomyces sp. HNM0575]